MIFFLPDYLGSVVQNNLKTEGRIKYVLVSKCLYLAWIKRSLTLFIETSERQIQKKKKTMSITHANELKFSALISFTFMQSLNFLGKTLRGRLLRPDQSTTDSVCLLDNLELKQENYFWRQNVSLFEFIQRTNFILDFLPTKL